MIKFKRATGTRGSGLPGSRLRGTSVAAAIMMLLGFVGLTGVSDQVYACGGFFCQNVPVDQAGEQIVFRQQGSTITAMVRILYTGDAEEFSWVVPVPNTPELSVGSDGLFDQLDFQTRPQFLLEQRGESCFQAVAFAESTDAASVADGDGNDSGGVQVEEQVVGPFDVQIVSSDDPAELATWLAENDYDLTSRGEELLEPYVLGGMKFVAVKLRSGTSSGSIQPLIMTYQGEKPEIPIRLTAVAAEEDMGVLTWVVADARAVPENYLHVIPNLGRLNWFQGAFNAYASYQGLITTAMDEAGGQGFATDFAGPVTGSITSAFNNADELEQNLLNADQIGDNAQFIANALNVDPTQQLSLDFLQATLPPPSGFDQFVYYDPISMQVAFSGEQLAAARPAYRQFLVERVIEPLRDSLELIPQGAYMTRLYTTLSPEEMTLDPIFVYNTAMPEQPVSREALLESNCTDDGTEWRLTLGAGTGREGEVVAQGTTEIPFAPPPEVIVQPAVFRSQTTSADDMPVDVTTNSITPVSIGNVSSFPVPETMSVATGPDDDDGFLGSTGNLMLVLLGLMAWRRRADFRD